VEVWVDRRSHHTERICSEWAAVQLRQLARDGASTRVYSSDTACHSSGLPAANSRDDTAGRTMTDCPLRGASAILVNETREFSSHFIIIFLTLGINVPEGGLKKN